MKPSNPPIPTAGFRPRSTGTVEVRYTIGDISVTIDVGHTTTMQIQDALVAFGEGLGINHGGGVDDVTAGSEKLLAKIIEVAQAALAKSQSGRAPQATSP